jgi:hypothetical protein
MRLLSRLEDERKYGAILYAIFRQSPKGEKASPQVETRQNEEANLTVLCQQNQPSMLTESAYLEYPNTDAEKSDEWMLAGTPEAHRGNRVDLGVSSRA